MQVVVRRHRLATTYSSFLRFQRFLSTSHPSTPSERTKADDDEWNDAWETAWLPDELAGKNRAPWEADVNFPDSKASESIVLPSNADPDTKAFVEEMDERWQERRMAAAVSSKLNKQTPYPRGSSDEQVMGEKRTDEDDNYRLRKQRIHAGLWMKEIEKMEESRLGDVGGTTGASGDIDRLLDSCAEIFDNNPDELDNAKIPSTSELKNKPDGWETTSKDPSGNVWEVTQRVEDILLQEFERRVAFSKFQIASFIKTHIFSRRRPIDGWRYMIEELGPNARKGKGSSPRMPSLADPSSRPFKEHKTASPKFPLLKVPERRR